MVSKYINKTWRSSIIEDQIKMSEAILSGVKVDAERAGLGEGILKAPRTEAETSGYYGDYQYPNNSQTFNGPNTTTSESGIERINDSKTAGFVSNPAFDGGLSKYALAQNFESQPGWKHRPTGFPEDPF
tara:strand:- start:148 stop:534 length:387 start_codon:yes stop_codon:yes gene_type:complete